MKHTLWNDVIPLTKELVVDESQDLFYYCGFSRYFNYPIQIDYGEDMTVVNYVLDFNEQEVKEKLNLDPKTYRMAKEVLREKRSSASYIVLLPFEVWDYLFEAIKDMPTKQKKTLIRVYLYLYYNAMCYTGSYSHARSAVIQELKMNKDSFSKACGFWEEKRLLRRTKYVVLDSNRTARTYIIPELLWTEACKRKMDKQSITNSENL